MIIIRMQLSKRRISVLDNDIGSVGPIRRIRQKTNMLMSPSRNMISPTPPGSSVSNLVAASSVQKHLLDEPKHNNTSNLRDLENDRNSSASFSAVPSQSTVMAQKILQQLDKLVSSPKEKSPELKLSVAREKSPAKLTLSMLDGPALKSVKDVDSSKILFNMQNRGALDGSGGSGSFASDVRDSIPGKQDKFDVNGATKISMFGDKKASEANGVQTKQNTKETVPNGRTIDSGFSNFVSRPPQKQGFQMSAHEVCY